MREFKFRAYQNGKMFYNVMCGGFEETVPTVFINSNWIHLDNCKIMQYTGFRDIIGREIYDGDIVRYSNKYIYGALLEFQSEVKITSFGITIISSVGNEIFLEKCFENCEIVGNKYEDSEV